MKKIVLYFLVVCLLLLTFPSSIFAEERVSSLETSPPDTIVRNYTEEETLPITAFIFNNDEPIGSYRVDEKDTRQNVLNSEKEKRELLYSPPSVNRDRVSTDVYSSSYYDRALPDLIVSPSAVTPPTVPVSPNASTIIYVKMGMVVNDTQNPYLLTKIVGIQGLPPTSLEAVVHLYRSTERYGTYNKISQMVTNWTAGQIWVGNSTVQSFANTSTYYYQTYNAGYAIWPVDSSGVPGVAGNNWSEYDILLNKLGQEYPAWRNIDVHGFLNATMPSSTQWATVPSSVSQALRNTFNSTVRDNFKTYYDQNYGYVNWVPTIEIHHIRPLQFGGGNDFNNLIPLHADIHSKFSFWFSYY